MKELLTVLQTRPTNNVSKQRLETFVRRAIRLGFYTADDPTLSQLATDLDDNLFANILLPFTSVQKLNRTSY